MALCVAIQGVASIRINKVVGTCAYAPPTFHTKLDETLIVSPLSYRNVHFLLEGSTVLVNGLRLINRLQCIPLEADPPVSLSSSIVASLFLYAQLPASFHVHSA